MSGDRGQAHRERSRTPENTTRRTGRSRPNGYWKSPEGQNEFLASVRAKTPWFDLTIVENPAWWRDHISNSNSKLDVTCTECNFRNSKIALSSAMASGLTCDCALWRSPCGRERALMLIAEQIHNANVSAMTPAWWKQNVHVMGDKLLITCVQCKEVRTPTINTLVSGKIGCFCTNRIFACEAGYNAFVAYLEENLSHISLGISLKEWMSGPMKIEGARSKVYLKCHRCTTSAHQDLGDIYTGKYVPRCKCRLDEIAASRRGHWQSGQGQREVLAMFADKFPHFDVDVIASLDWWKANITNSVDSPLDVTCTLCNFRNTNVIIYSLMFAGRNVGCECGLYRSAGGRDRVMALLAERHPNADASAMTLTWWEANVQTFADKLLVTCRTCGETCTPTLGEIMRAQDSHHGRTIGCFCTSGNSATEAGYDAFVAFLTKHPDIVLQTTRDEWISDVENANTKVRLRCNQCHLDFSQSIRAFHRGYMPNCSCNKFKWRSQRGYERFHEIVQSTEKIESLMDWTYWEANVQDIQSKVLLKCLNCNVVVDTTNILNFTMRGKVGCSCQLKTEAILYEFLVETYGTTCIKRQVREIPNPTTGRYLRYDFLVRSAVVIELDGMLGHFGKGWGSIPITDCPRRDLAKEVGAMRHGKSVLRLLQPDVLYDKFDWKAFVKDGIAELTEGEPRVLTQDSTMYSTSVYAELRPAPERTTRGLVFKGPFAEDENSDSEIN